MLEICKDSPYFVFFGLLMALTVKKVKFEFKIKNAIKKSKKGGAINKFAEA
jgi:hypothetical protein